MTFYRQVRRDGGIRTGVEINGEPALGRFETGDDEADPVLDWFVDIRCLVNKLPNDPEGARQWLLDDSGSRCGNHPRANTHSSKGFARLAQVGDSLEMILKA